MNFIFSCPETGQIFETDAFKMVENRGITEDGSGSRVLDAKVKLETPCPFCGKQHIFHASELVCPFSADK